MENAPETLTAAKTLVQTGGLTPSGAARQLNLPERTVRGWAKHGKWGKGNPPLKEVLGPRAKKPLDNPDKTPKEPRRSKEAKPLGAKKRGAVHLSVDWCYPAKDEFGLYPYQEAIASSDERTLLWLKSRQIGASTHVIPARALRRGLTLGHDQIFISASRNHVEMLGDCVRNMGTRLTGVEWTGNKYKIEVRQGGNIVCTFRFLTAKSNLGQGFSGDLYIDEAAWTERMEKVAPLAMAMASLRGYTRFFASSAGKAESYFMRLVEGEAPINGKKIKAKIVKTTIHDAIAGGNPYLDVKNLMEDYSEAEFKQLYECQAWLDETSVFPERLLRKCQTTHPLNLKKEDMVWVGYDPARTIDFACAMVTTVRDGRLHLVECLLWKNKTADEQAKSLKKLNLRYNVQEFALDVTGFGKSVADAARALGLPIRQIHYSRQRKNDLVLRMRSLVERKELGLPVAEERVIKAFLAIKQVGAAGGQVIYISGRSLQFGHAEPFWALSHAADIAPVGKINNLVQIF